MDVSFYFLPSEGIPLEQGLRRHNIYLNVIKILSEGIPLEQGLRHRLNWLRNLNIEVSEGIPLEQGLRR